MDKKDFLLSFLYANNNEPVEGTIKLMKQLFLIQMKNEGEIIYEFQPYDLGPVSFEVHKDIKELKRDGLIKTDERRNFEIFSLTAEGIIIAKRKFDNLNSDMKEKIISVKKEFNSKDKNALVLYIYNTFPKFTYRSKYKSFWRK